jgi:acetylornithine deacetylase
MVEDPFRLTERNGRLYGRGAADMKGFDACCLAAVPDMLAARLARPIHLAFSYDEEVGCVGVRSMIARLERAKVKPAACFVGEPTEMGVVIGHKGQRAFRVTVHGKSCHSSLAPHGVNAVEYAARLIAKIRDISVRLARSGARDPLYDVPYTTANSGVVHGGAALNIVPDRCTFEFEFRPLAADDVDGLVEEVMAFAREQLEPEMQVVDPAARIVFEPKSAWPGLETPVAFDVVGLGKTLAGRNEHSKVAFGTEAGLFALSGIPTVVSARARSIRHTKPTSTLRSRSSKRVAPSSTDSPRIRAHDFARVSKFDLALPALAVPLRDPRTGATLTPGVAAPASASRVSR